MSGYLQRLVRSVTQPAETIHPLAGSLFSAPQREKEQQASPLRQEIASTAEGSPASTLSQRAQEDHGLPLPPGLAIPSLISPAASPKSAIGEESSFQRLRPAAGQDERLMLAESKPESGGAAVVGKEDGQAERVYAPLMTEVRVRSGDPALPGLKANFSRPAPAKAKRDSPHREAREPDDIQIHIGRIEVTAVQQAPARAAFKPARKGQSLDEYLKHRDRRA